MPQVLCKDCTYTLIQSYIFKRLHVYSHDRWSEAISKLEKGLEGAVALRPSTRSVYLVVNKKDNVIFTSHKSCSEKNKTSALVRIKQIVKSRDTYNRQKNFKQHCAVWKKQSNNSCICSVCGKMFESELFLTKHMAVHSENKISCPKCAKVFPTWKQVLGHMDRMHKPKVIQCNKCSKKFSTKPMLAYHQQMHHVAATCKLCLMQFPSKYALRAHLDKHEANYYCPTCGKSYKSKSTFKIHQSICGVVEKTPNFFCDVCGKGYIRKNGIRTHLKVDHGFGKVFSCEWCSKKFDAISRLKMHTVKHTKERNFSCDMCGGRFVTHPALIYHKRLHTGEKPFPCDMCNESFLSASRRMEHKHRKHFDPTKECHLCNMKFVMASQLKKHVSRHYNSQSKLYIPNAVPSQDFEMETVII